MNDQLAKLKRIAIFLATIFTASIPAMAHADWSIKGLGTLAGKYSTATGINDSGQVVGFSTFVDDDYFFGSHAFITGSEGAGMTDLGTLLDGGQSNANGINDHGQVVGGSGTASGDIHGFIAGPNIIGMNDLGTLGGAYSEAFGINNSGQVVGQSQTARGFYHAFITGPNGNGLTDLGTLGGTSSRASGINDSGQVAGVSQTASGFHHAFITGPNGNDMTDLGTLGGTSSSASGINDSGQVVGNFQIAGGYHAFITGPNGIGMIDLGILGGFISYAYATSINNIGEAVGQAGAADGELHSFIFSHGGMTDLSLLAPVVAAGWTNLNTLSINDNGQMVGYGLHNGHWEAFLLSYTPDTIFDPKPIYIPPVPEPETYLMLLGGLGWIGYFVRRRKEMVI